MSGSSPTKDKILTKSRELFNSEGFGALAAVDIANHLSMSPGHLYYHFKGKEQIIAEIFQQYELALGSTLTAPLEQPLSTKQGPVEDNWYYLYVVMEEMYQYRFLYYNLDDILQRYPDIRKGFKRLLQLKRVALFAICQNLLQQDIIDARDQQLLGLVDNMTLTLTFWFNYDQLLHDGRAPEITIHQGVLQLLTMVAPYLGDNELSFYRDCENIYSNMLRQAE